MVKYEEMQLGYKYELLIIGHLNEAEEEAIESFPALAHTVRYQRVVFQDTRKIEFDSIIEMLKESINASD